MAKRLGENYIPPPKRPLAAFAGSGNRLGSPVPTAISEVGGVEPMPGSFPGGSGSGSGSASTSSHGMDSERISTRFEVDQTLPTTSIQIRLADGTRFEHFTLVPFSY